MEELSRQFKVGEINKNQLKEAARDLIKGYGKDIGIDFEVVYLDEETMPKDSKGSTGSAYILDKKNRKVLIPIDVSKIGDIKELLGTLTEEVSHGKDALEGRQDKKVAEDKSNDEEGLESLGRPANDYVKNKLGNDNNSNISLTTDGIGLTNADVGEKVGDKANEGWDIYKLDIRNHKQPNGEYYSEKEIQSTINNTFGKGSFNVDWKKYEKDEEYREKTNYYYFQAKYFVKVDKIDKLTDTYVDITQINGKKLRLNRVPAKEAILHNMKIVDKVMYFYFNENYKKYLNEDGLELIFDKDNKPVYDPLITGTYNFYTYERQLSYDGIMHGIVDVGLYKKYGTGPNDPTTKEEREKISGYFAAEISFITYSLLKAETNLKNKDSLSYDEIREFLGKKIDEIRKGNENFGSDISEK